MLADDDHPASTLLTEPQMARATDGEVMGLVLRDEDGDAYTVVGVHRGRWSLGGPWDTADATPAELAEQGWTLDLSSRATAGILLGLLVDAEPQSGWTLGCGPDIGWLCVSYTEPWYDDQPGWAPAAALQAVWRRQLAAAGHEAVGEALREPEQCGAGVDLAPEALSDLLSLVMHEDTPPATAVARWSPERRREAEAWAAATHLHASDHDDVEVPPEPAWLVDGPPWCESCGAHATIGDEDGVYVCSDCGYDCNQCGGQGVIDVG